MQEGVEAYYILLSVTLHQEVAVRHLFQHLHWTLHCQRVPTSLDNIIKSYLDEHNLQFDNQNTHKPDSSTNVTDETNEEMVSAVNAVSGQNHTCPELCHTEMITKYITIQELKQYLSNDALFKVLDQIKVTCNDITADTIETEEAEEESSDVEIVDTDVQTIILRNTKECLKNEFSHKSLLKKKNDLKTIWKNAQLKTVANEVETCSNSSRSKQGDAETVVDNCKLVNHVEIVKRHTYTKDEIDDQSKNDNILGKCTQQKSVSTDDTKTTKRVTYPTSKSHVQYKNNNNCVKKKLTKGRRDGRVCPKAIKNTKFTNITSTRSVPATCTVNRIGKTSGRISVDEDNTGIVNRKEPHTLNSESYDNAISENHSSHSYRNKPTVPCSNSRISDSNITNKPRKRKLDNPWKCSYCHVTFKKLSRPEQLSHLASHFNKNEEEPKQSYKPITRKSLECELCGKKLSSTKWLTRHMKLSHVNGAVTKKKKLYPMSKCSICKKEMSSHSISAHMKAMHDENKTGFVCDICGAYLRTQGNLKHHREIVHTDTRPHTCNICNLSFKAISTYRVHMRRHDPDGKQTCPTCGKTISFGQLGQHLKRHSNNKKYHCGSCEKSFHEKQDLLRHERVHTGDKPYKCNLCTYACALQGNLKKHLNSHNVTRDPARLADVVNKLKQTSKRGDYNARLINTANQDNNKVKQAYNEDKYANMTAVDLTGINPMFQNYTQLLSITPTIPQDVINMQHDAAVLSDGPGELKIVDSIQNVSSVELSDHHQQHYSDLTLSTPLQIAQHADSDKRVSMLHSDHLHTQSTRETEVVNTNIHKSTVVQDSNQFSNVARSSMCNTHNVNTPEDAYRQNAGEFTPTSAASYVPMDMQDSMRNASGPLPHLHPSLPESMRQTPSDVHHLMKAYPYFFQTYQQ